MNGEKSSQSTLEIIHATKESRELLRIRNSFTFKLGIELTKCLRNPLKLLILPFRIISLLISTKSSIYSNEILGYEDFVVVGVDRNGQQYSIQAKYLAELICKTGLGEVTLLNNSSTNSIPMEGIEWYRFPPVRGKNTSRKEWNLMIERLLSSAMSITKPKHIFYFGDYLYRGIVDAFSNIDSSVPITWLIPSDKSQMTPSTEKLPRIKTMLIPEFTDKELTYQSIHKKLRRSESEQIILTDLDPLNAPLIDVIINLQQDIVVAGVQRDFPLPKGVEFAVRMKEVLGVRIEGRTIVVLDEASPLIPYLPILKVPCLMLRNGNRLSPLLEAMILDMELKGTLVVVRRSNSDDINQSLNYIFSIADNYRLIERINHNGLDDYQSNLMINWLKKHTYS